MGYMLFLGENLLVLVIIPPLVLGILNELKSIRTTTPRLKHRKIEHFGKNCFKYTKADAPLVDLGK